MGGRDRPAEPTGAQDGTLTSHRFAAESGRDVSELPKAPCGWLHTPALGIREIAENRGIASGDWKGESEPAAEQMPLWIWL